jgi:hypothetical protein
VLVVAHADNTRRGLSVATEGKEAASSYYDAVPFHATAFFTRAMGCKP